MEKYIQPFVDVCINVFKEFIGVDITAERPHFEDMRTVFDWDISAVIGLAGEARGAVVVSMKNGLAVKLTGILTGSEHKDMDDEVVDAIGELVNIIAGNAKKGLEENFRLTISLPTIVQGKGHQIKWPAVQSRIIYIPFNLFENDVFTLMVAIESVKKSVIA